MLIGALEAGGTKMVCAVGKEDGTILEQVSIPTTTPEETIPKLIEYFKDKEIEALGDNSWRVLGSAPLDAITEETGVAFPEDLDFDTLGGLVMSTLRSIPEDGSVFDVEAYGLKIHVSKVEDRRVEEAFLQLDQPKEEPEEEERER